ncbi:hypothetical protein UA08_07475 [Talaromyces atroroseus]|uniref:Uncharacterized protein n=1 Tax=Talaromyces atroroseus TaxID=1441469 RepID=A0A225ANZ3_TALAT|nr:hypothetical protein UA08_07475 [Talaromyces atroroseus]OKL57319.1 hypothetical protein UA08_07475 [Talaromyces atroroseus]
MESGTATSVISMRKQRFTGDLHFHANGSSYLITEPGHLQYVGNPSPEIDKNWHDMINESEAKQAWSDNFDGYFDVIEGERWYVGGLDILHTLHCLNTLRMHLDPEYYSEHMSHRPSQNHNYHCIDQIRQYLMCYGDLTPVSTRWHDGKGRIYVQSDMNHTCRNFDGVLEWVRGRKIVY